MDDRKDGKSLRDDRGRQGFRPTVPPVTSRSGSAIELLYGVRTPVST
jgi:hypothetical protein